EAGEVVPAWALTPTMAVASTASRAVRNRERGMSGTFARWMERYPHIIPSPAYHWLSARDRVSPALPEDHEPVLSLG
ncbi:hypothetical protein UU5_05693, partial [Rhodanobacter sp. 115]